MLVWEDGIGARGVKAIGLDLGRRRIGIAVSDPTGTLATPWRTVNGGDRRAGRGKVAGLLASWRRRPPCAGRGRPPAHLDAASHEDDPA